MLDTLTSDELIIVHVLRSSSNNLSNAHLFVRAPRCNRFCYERISSSSTTDFWLPFIYATCRFPHREEIVCNAALRFYARQWMLLVKLIHIKLTIADIESF